MHTTHLPLPARLTAPLLAAALTLALPLFSATEALAIKEPTPDPIVVKYRNTQWTGLAGDHDWNNTANWDHGVPRNDPAESTIYTPVLDGFNETIQITTPVPDIDSLAVHESGPQAELAIAGSTASLNVLGDVYIGFEEVKGFTLDVMNGATLNIGGHLYFGMDESHAALNIKDATVSVHSGAVFAEGGQSRAEVWLGGTGLLEVQGSAGTMPDDNDASLILYQGTSMTLADNSRLVVENTLFMDNWGETYGPLPTITFELSDERTAGAFITAQSLWAEGGILDLTGLGDMSDGLTLLLFDTAEGDLAGMLANLTLLFDGQDLGLVDFSTGEETYEFTYQGRDYTLALADGGHDLTLTAAPVPEPGTYAMILGGLGVLTLLRRRARN